MNVFHERHRLVLNLPSFPIRPATAEDVASATSHVVGRRRCGNDTTTNLRQTEDTTLVVCATRLRRHAEVGAKDLPLPENAWSVAGVEHGVHAEAPSAEARLRFDAGPGLIEGAPVHACHCAAPSPTTGGEYVCERAGRQKP